MQADPEFKTLQIKKLHPTFGAEVSGVDFTKPIPDDVFQEILAAMAKVRNCHRFYLCCWLSDMKMVSGIVWVLCISQDWFE